MGYIIKISFKNKGVENMKIFGKELTFNGNKVYHAGNKPTASEIGAAASSHTHNYAGSSSAGGAANSALTATKATQDSAGQQINTTYIKGLSVSGKTITYTKGDGTTGTITTQDTNTTYSTGTASTSGLTKLYTGTGTATDGTMTQAAINTALSGKAASSHTHNYAGSSSAGGNANAAVKLSTARTINGTSFDGSANITTANWGTARNIQIGNTAKSVNGSANVTWSLSEIGAAAASHGRHMPDTCETITDWNNATKNGWYMGNNATNSPTANAWYFGEVIAHNANYVVQTVYQFTASTDAKSIPKYIRAKMNGTWGAWTNVTVSKAVPSNAVFTDTNTWRGVQDNLTSTATDQSLSANQGKVLKGLIDGKAASSHTHNYAGSSSAGGAANSATKLATARSINGTNFDGTGNITTANWGTARTITIGNTGKSVNGSGNISWSLSEIGAAAASHTHNYIPASTGSSISIHADSDSSSTGEYLLLKAGHNELKITSSAGGATVTKGQDKLTFNGNIVYHAGRKPTAAEIGAASTSALETVKQNISDVERNTARANHTHTNITNIASRGNVTCESGTARPSVSGASMGQVYNNGYPTQYGNVLTLKGAGDGQILIGWSGNDGAHAPVYVRSKRDTSTANWSGWAQVYTTAHKPSASDVGALPLSGGTMRGSIQLPSNGGSWLNGATNGNLRGYKQSSGSFHPIISQTTSNNHKIALGGLGDDFGFYMYDANRTENGIDGYFKFMCNIKEIESGCVINMGNHLKFWNNNALLFATHGGGWFMSDSTWIRAYNDKNIYTGGEVKCNRVTTRSMDALDGQNIDINTKGRALGLNCSSASGVWVEFKAQWSGSKGTEPSLFNTSGNGWGYIGGSGYSWYRVYGAGGSVSDRNKKYDIAKADCSEQYENIKNINLYNYRTISDKVNEETGDVEEKIYRQDLMLGCMVDELPTETVFYDNESGDGKAVDMYSYTSMILGATKHLINKVETLEKENEIKNNKISELEQRLEKMEELLNGIINKG